MQPTINQSTTEKGFNTYFANNLTVIKDNALYKVLFKLTSLQMKEYNKAVKNNLTTDNITFQYSLNEFRMDLQMGKSTIIKKLDILSSVKLLTITKNCDEKNSYQLNINKLNEIVSKLNGMRRLQRIEYINSIFGVTTSKSFTKIDEGKFGNETSTPKYAASSAAPKQTSIIIPLTKEDEQEVAVNNMVEQMKNLNTNEDMTLKQMNIALNVAEQQQAIKEDIEQNFIEEMITNELPIEDNKVINDQIIVEEIVAQIEDEYNVKNIKPNNTINKHSNGSIFDYLFKQVEAKQMTVNEVNKYIKEKESEILGSPTLPDWDVTDEEDNQEKRLKEQKAKLHSMYYDDEDFGEDVDFFDYGDKRANAIINAYPEERVDIWL
ncbi:MAG: hypothetical protein LBV71_16180 [Prevotella sp.]|jgi:hypothetical protein|nr:hypothetical protein [Prevotella sp.]